MRRPLVLAVAAVAAALLGYVVLVAPRGFHSGDSGAKLIQAHDLWTQRFRSRALLSNPEVGRPERYRRAGRDFERKVGREIQGIYSVAFVAPAAVAVGLLGEGGLPVLPALGGLGVAVGVALLLSRLGVRPAVAAVAAALATLATPVLFYSAQFFEHAPAAGLVALALAAAAPLPDGRSRPLLGGALVALAAAMRPEVYLAVAGLGLGVIVQPGGLGLRARRGALFLAGALAVLGGYWLLNHFSAGAWDPLVASNETNQPTRESGFLMLWGAIRRPGDPRRYFLLAALPAAAALLPPLPRDSGWLGRLFNALRLAAAVAAVVPIAVFAHRAQAFPGRSLAGFLTVSPFLAIGLLVGPWRSRSAWLWAFVLVAGPLVPYLDRSATGGGLQVGGRMLLPIVPALAALVGIWIDDLLELHPPERLAGAALVLALVAVSLLGLKAGLETGHEVARKGEVSARVAAAGPGRLVLVRREWEAQLLSTVLLHGKDVAFTPDKDNSALFRRLVAGGHDGLVYVCSDAVDVPLPDGRRLVKVGGVGKGESLLTVQYLAPR